MDKFTLHLGQTFPYAQNPTFTELSADKILLNNVILPKTIDNECGSNPHRVGLYVIGHEFGAICAVWASHEQEALDEACDGNMLECLLAENQDYEDETLSPLGNASELHDLSNAWIGRVQFDAARDIQLIVAIVRATENQKTTIGDYS